MCRCSRRRSSPACCIASTELGREIPAGLYLAVAQVLSYVFQVATLNPTRAARLKRRGLEVDPELRVKYDRDEVAE